MRSCPLVLYLHIEDLHEEIGNQQRSDIYKRRDDVLWLFEINLLHILLSTISLYIMTMRLERTIHTLYRRGFLPPTLLIGGHQTIDIH